MLRKLRSLETKLPCPQEGFGKGLLDDSLCPGVRVRVRRALELWGTITTWNWNSKPKYGSKPSKPCTSVVQIIAGIAGIAGSSGCSSSFQNCIYTYMSWKDVCFVTHRTLNFGKDLPTCPQSFQLRDLWKKFVAPAKNSHCCMVVTKNSLDWFKGRFTGNHVFYHQI